MNFIPRLGIVSDLPTIIRDGAVTLKDSHGMGYRRIVLKISALLSLIKAFRVHITSVGSISLDTIVDALWMRSHLMVEQSRER
jgi:hypothetical protein